MTKDDVLFSIIGLLLGFILGYMLTNNFNQRALAPAPAASEPPPAGLAQAPPGGPAQNPQADPQALDQAQQQAAAKPNDYDAQFQAGEVFYQAWRYDEAAKYYEKASQLRPDSTVPMIALGNNHFDHAARFQANDRWPLAEKWYAAALAKDSKNVNARTDLGLTFFFREPPDYDRALKEFRKSLELNPQHEPTLQNMAALYIKKNDKATAQDFLSKLEKLNPQNPALNALREDLAKLK